MDKFIIRKLPEKEEDQVSDTSKDEIVEKEEPITKRINMSLFSKFEPSASISTKSNPSKSSSVSTKTVQSSLPAELNIPLVIPDRYRETLSSEQIKALELVCQRKSVFISGPGGTGKSHWIKACKSILSENKVFMPVCALTGCAAILLGCGATTVHSCFGLGQMKGDPQEIVRKVLRNKRVTNKLKKIQGFIIDEVSMMSQKMMEVLELAMRSIKKTTTLWGGVQVIFLGDFYQLPPVGMTKEDTAFCFESELWGQTFPSEQHVLFTTMHRQKDPLYQKILHEVRIGELSEESIEVLQKRVDLQLPEAIFTRLYPKKYIVENTNNEMYGKLKTREECFEMKIVTNLTSYKESGKSIPTDELLRCSNMTKYDRENEIKRLARDGAGSEKLYLKLNTPVMCTMNVDLENGIYNGSQGKVIEFRDSPEHGLLPVVKFNNGKVIEMEPYCWQSDEYPMLGVKQVPLQLAWAMTIHKSQGSSLDNVIMNLGNHIFEYGQSYVALSRVRTLEGLYLSGLAHERIKANPIVREFYNSIHDLKEETK